MDALTIAQYLGRNLFGENIKITSHSSLNNPQQNSVVFAKALTSKSLEALASSKDVLVIAKGNKEELDTLNITYVLSENPRLDFVRVVRQFFSVPAVASFIHKTAIIEKGARVAEDVTIGPHCYIGKDVRIGSRTTIMPNVSIYGKVTIGERCYIKPGAVIGGPGFGFECDEEGIPIHFPHSGEVHIGNDVYIGANVTIDRATMDATIIEDNVKIDNLAHVAHNCHIKRNTLVTAGAVFSGGTIIGEGAWVAPNATIHQKVKIGDKSTVGIGAVVIRNVKPNTTVFGNPASKVEQG